MCKNSFQKSTFWQIWKTHKTKLQKLTIWSNNWIILRSLNHIRPFDHKFWPWSTGRKNTYKKLGLHLGKNSVRLKNGLSRKISSKKKIQTWPASTQHQKMQPDHQMSTNKFSHTAIWTISPLSPHQVHLRRKEWEEGQFWKKLRI